MIAVDTNILVYAHQTRTEMHAAARDRLVALAEGTSPWGLPVFCLGEFLRVVTHPRIFDPPFSVAEAGDAVQRLLASPGLVVLAPADRYPELLIEAVLEARALGNLVFDAQIVAVCREWGVDRLLTEDRDFDRFSGLETLRL